MNQKTAKQIRKVATKVKSNLPPRKILGLMKRDWLQSSHKKRGAMRPALKKAAKP